MPLSTQSDQGDGQYVLVASLDNVRNLSNILKAITFKDHALFNATPNGLKVTVEDSKCLQANAFIQVGIKSTKWIRMKGCPSLLFSEKLTVELYLHDLCLLQSEIFQEFTIQEDSVSFQVNLTVLLDCLTIFGGSTVPGIF